MLTVGLYANQKVGVLGLGKSGLSAARALRDGGAEVIAWDDGAAAREKAEKAGFKLTDLSADDAPSITVLVLSPGIPHTHPAPHPAVSRARAAGVPIIGDVDLLARSQAGAGFIGITGTNGKSTTTALLGHILKGAGLNVEVGGNLGTPVLDLEPLGKGGHYLLEMSSYQLELAPTAVFSVAVLTNITPDHLSRHGGMEGYIAAKKEIFTHQTPEKLAVIGVDDAPSMAIYDDMKARRQCRLVPISGCRHVPGGVYVESGWLVDDRQGRRQPLMTLDKAKALPGAHNAQNAAAATAAALGLDVPVADILEGLRTFPGLAHRQERIAERDGVLFVNDSKATNAEAATKALSSYDAIHWIIGGRPKEDGLTGVEPYLGRVVRAYAIGEAEEAFGTFLKPHVPVDPCGTLERALAAAWANARKTGGVVLLAPACASFDQFKSFEHRGDAFRAAVENLLAEVSA
ncbi:MAG: UDP-N-acetylmuramoyl-L-alanine--D-glutamate ligase [Rhodospirillales bacterium]